MNNKEENILKNINIEEISNLSLPKKEEEDNLIFEEKNSSISSIKENNYYFIYNKLLLYVRETEIQIEPIGLKEEEFECLIINRIDFKLEIKKIPLNTKSGGEIIYGIIGIIPLLVGNYLITINEREKIGFISGHEIFKANKMNIIQIPVDDAELSDEDKKIEKGYLNMLENFLSSSNFYFSYTYDITRNAQNQLSKNEKNLYPIWMKTDSRFFWNYYVLQDFIKKKLHSWILPVMDEMFTETLNEQTFIYTLISRRSCKRTGARYHIRGADPLGNVANFVETEQIVESMGNISSFVQIRGSIPLIWHQKSKALKPKPIVDHSLISRSAFKLHFKEQLELYNDNVVVVSLVDQTGIESELAAQFELNIKLLNNNNIRYVPFDFHSKCRNGKYENLSFLLDEVKNDLLKFQYFLKDHRDKVVLFQSGIFRTNCIDCLDRTNVVQSLFAYFMLKLQLNHLGIISSTESIKLHQRLENIFKNVWADNADILSEQYTGTGALKTDYTRTGKRSVVGMATDGINSMKRYLNTIFQDDIRQASIDLFLGKYTVTKLNFLETDNVHRFHVTQASESEGINEKLSALLEINLKDQTISEYLIEPGQIRIFSFDSLKFMEKSHINYKLLRLTFNISSQPTSYIFSSAIERQKFVELIRIYCFKEIISKPNKSVSELIKIFIGHWDMKFIKKYKDISSLENWIQKDMDIYVIGVLNCEFEVPSNISVSLNAENYLLYIILLYLGFEYQCIGVVSTKQQNGTTYLFILVHQNYTHKIASINNSKVYIKNVDTNKIQLKTFKWKERSSKPKIIQDSTPKIEQKITKEKDKSIIGGAIMFRIYDTGFCFLNCLYNPPKNSQDLAVLLLKNGNDIANHFHHVFCIGNINENLINYNGKWVNIYANNGLVLWRSLPNCGFLSSISVGTDKEWKENFPPIFVCLNISTVKPPLLSKNNNIYKLIISNISVQNIPISMITKLEIFLDFYAIFLKEKIRIQPTKRPFIWYQSYEMDLLFDLSSSSIEYLQHHYLYVDFWIKETNGEEYFFGSGVISLKNYITIMDKEKEFSTEIIHEDEINATLVGNIQIKTSDIINNFSSSPSSYLNEKKTIEVKGIKPKIVHLP